MAREILTAARVSFDQILEHQLRWWLPWLDRVPRRRVVAGSEVDVCRRTALAGDRRLVAASTIQEPLIDHAEPPPRLLFPPGESLGGLRGVLRDLRKAGLELPSATYREIVEWRFPLMLDHQNAGAWLNGSQSP
jgi:hypothetical protein